MSTKIEFELLSMNVFSPSWWLAYIVNFAQREPTHLAVEVICGLIIFYLVFSKEYKPDNKDKLTKQEEQSLIDDWKPEPLAPPSKTDEKKRIIIESVASAVTRVDGQDYLNYSSSNFAGLAGREEIRKECEEVIINYGVGSCGPRGFFGTNDQHVELETTVAKFMGTNQSILYSDGIGCISSLIPAFAKAGDVIIVDEYCNHSIFVGCKLSRSTVLKYKHNDMEDLEKLMASVVAKDAKKQKKLTRRFVITEGIFLKTGIIGNIKKVHELKKKYKFRSIIDDSLAIGVLGQTGRGSFEYHGFSSAYDLDIVCFNLDTTLAGVGGVCVGSDEVISHQRLSGSGYCFSAASPPYTARASTVALALIDANPELCETIRSKAMLFRSNASKINNVKVLGGSDSVSPTILLTLDTSSNTEAVLDKISQKLREQYILAFPTVYIPGDKEHPASALRFNVTALHSDEDIISSVKIVSQVINSVLSDETTGSI